MLGGFDEDEHEEDGVEEDLGMREKRKSGSAGATTRAEAESRGLAASAQSM